MLSSTDGLMQFVTGLSQDDQTALRNCLQSLDQMGVLIGQMLGVVHNLILDSKNRFILYRHEFLLRNLGIAQWPRQEKLILTSEDEIQRFNDFFATFLTTTESQQRALEAYQSLVAQRKKGGFGFAPEIGVFGKLSERTIQELQVEIAVCRAQPLIDIDWKYCSSQAGRPGASPRLLGGGISDTMLAGVPREPVACLFSVKHQAGEEISTDDAINVVCYFEYLKKHKRISGYNFTYNSTKLRVSINFNRKDDQLYGTDCLPELSGESPLVIEALSEKVVELNERASKESGSSITWDKATELRKRGSLPTLLASQGISSTDTSMSRDLSTPLLSGKSKSKPFWRNWKFWLGVGVAVTAVAAVALTIVTGGAALMLGALALGGLTAAVVATVVATTAAKAAAASATAASSVALAPLASATTSPVISSVAPAATSSLVPDAVLAATGLAAVVPPLAAAAAAVTFFKMNKGKAEAELPEQKNFPIRP